YDTKNAGSGKILSVSAGYNVNDGNSGNNYTLSIVADNTGVINPLSITVTAATNTKTYDGGVTAAALPTITAGSLVGSDSATLSETYDTKDSGTGKTLTPLASIADGNSGGNYAVTYVTDSTGEIDKAALTITADDKTKAFGTVNPALTASYSGLVGGDTSSVVTGLSLATTATTASPVGTYPITASGGIATNYVLSYVDGALVITAVPSPAPSPAVQQASRQGFDPAGWPELDWQTNIAGSGGLGSVGVALEHGGQVASLEPGGEEGAEDAFEAAEEGWLDDFYNYLKQFFAGRNAQPPTE
ncbi:MAG: hypothetical protein KGI43_08825, partial [Alphaproteobacteria bacterium]|nr:hypothetical protein [Alphaproteobacteria bacterium]